MIKVNKDAKESIEVYNIPKKARKIMEDFSQEVGNSVVEEVRKVSEKFYAGKIKEKTAMTNSKKALQRSLPQYFVPALEKKLVEAGVKMTPTLLASLGANGTVFNLKVHAVVEEERERMSINSMISKLAPKEEKEEKKEEADA